MKKRKKSQCGRRGEKIFSNLCIAPSFLGVMFFFFVPFCIIIYYSVVNNPIMRDFVGIDNFIQTVKNPA
ncbi:MAG: sugar ABC transporter permease, partial [Ruminococcus sp.]